MPIWDYNDKLYLKTNDLKLRELPGEHVFQKDVPYSMDLTFSKYDFEKKGGQITGYSISEIKRYLVIRYTYKMGLPESALKPFSFFKSLQGIM